MALCQSTLCVRRLSSVVTWLSMGNCFFLLASNLKCHNIRFVEKLAGSDESLLDRYCRSPCELLLVVTGVPFCRGCRLLTRMKKKKVWIAGRLVDCGNLRTPHNLSPSTAEQANLCSRGSICLQKRGVQTYGLTATCGPSPLLNGLRVILKSK